MAQITELSPAALPGAAHSFLPKLPAIGLRLRRTGTIACHVAIGAGDQIRLKVRRTQGSNDVYVLPDVTVLSVRTERPL